MAIQNDGKGHDTDLGMGCSANIAEGRWERHHRGNGKVSWILKDNSSLGGGGVVNLVRGGLSHVKIKSRRIMVN